MKLHGHAICTYCDMEGNSKIRLCSAPMHRFCYIAIHGHEKEYQPKFCITENQHLFGMQENSVRKKPHPT